MIKEEDLLDAIAECQGERNPTANTCRNLAAYYTILDHIKKDDANEGIPIRIPSIEYISYEGSSEFANIINGRDINEILPVIDELMETLQVINPRLYDGVIRKIS